MRFNLKKGLVAASLALAFGQFGAAQAADTIQFDPDGTAVATNGTFNVGAFDWAVASALADNSVASPSSFELYFHTALQGFQDVNGNPAGSPTGLNTTFEITVIGGFTESISITSVSTPTLVSDGGDGVGGGNDVYTFTTNANLTGPQATSTNFITIFYDDFSGTNVQSDALSGLGYDDGTVILTATLTSVTGTFAATQQFIDVNNNGTYDPGVDTDLGVLLDQFGTDNWAGQLSLTGDGSTSLTANVDSSDPTFFLTAITGLLQDLDFTTETNIPFEQTNPSQSFDTTGAPLTLAGGGLNLGTINGLSGPDLLLQADASTSFTTAVPEPGILSLLGLSLVGLAISRRKVYR